MRFEWTVGARLVRSRKKRFLSVITNISIVGIVLGVTALTVVLAVTGGFQREFRQRVLGLQPHLLVRKYGNFTEYRDVMASLKQSPHVKGVTPATYDEMMLLHKLPTGGQRRAGAYIKGVDVPTFQSVTDLGRFMQKGSVEALDGNPKTPGIILGSELAKKLQATIGSTVLVLSPLRGMGGLDPAPFGMAPTAGSFKVVGIFSNGFYEHDLRLALVSFKAMQKFMNRGDFAYWVEVRIDDLFHAKEIGVELKDYIEPYPLDKFLKVVWQFKHDVDRIAKGEIRQAKIQKPTTPIDMVSQLQSIARVTGYRADFELERKEKYQVLDWQTRNKNLFTSLALQRVIFALFFMIIIFVAAFNVVGSQTMIIKDKTKEIAILKSMGATKASIRSIFVIQGMIIGLIGTGIGLVFGFGLSYLIKSWKYPLDPMVYFISYLPIDVNPLEFVGVGIASLICILVASYYASGKAAEKTPVDGLRQV